MKTNKKLMTRIGAGVGITALSIGALAGVADVTGSTHKGDNEGNGPVSSFVVAARTITQTQEDLISDTKPTERPDGEKGHMGGKHDGPGVFGKGANSATSFKKLIDQD